MPKTLPKSPLGRILAKLKATAFDLATAAGVSNAEVYEVLNGRRRLSRRLGEYLVSLGFDVEGSCGSSRNPFSNPAASKCPIESGRTPPKAFRDKSISSASRNLSVRSSIRSNSDS